MAGAAHPDKIWWTATELARAGLPDMPGTQQNIEAMAKRLGWRGHPVLARARAGRGGGWEYSWQLLPLGARRKLLCDAAPVPDKHAPSAAERGEIQAYYESLPERVKGKAQARLRVLQTVGAMERSGLTRYLAVATVAKMEAVCERTVWNWLSMVGMVGDDDWLFYLAPRGKAAVRPVRKAPVCHEFMTRLKADFLRLERPSFSSCYRRCLKLAKAKGFDRLAERTARRRLSEQVPRVSQIFAREGYIGLARCFPPQTRDRSSMVALEGVNADCHKFDVFVQWPGENTPSRAQIVAFQDLYSNKILAWRIDHSPNKVAVMAAFGDMIEHYGIPQHCLFDNGREFANKWLTGGVPTRFRFKIRDDDPLGVLPLLGIQVHWATPAHGQAKPIERAFRDFADDIAKDPRFAGAYVGNRPDAKPENYASAAVPLATFVRVVSEGIVEHNARLGRLTDAAQGRSFDETFAASYGAAPIRKATDEQRRLWLMGQDIKKMSRSHGLIRLHGNEYWADWMNELAGTRVAVRFDPEDLHAGIYIYGLDGAFMGYAPCREKAGFFDLTAARDTARQTAAVRRTERRLLAQLRPMKVGELAAEMDQLDAPQSEPLEARVVAPAFGARDRAPLVTRPVVTEDISPEEAARQAAFVADFGAEKARRAEQAEDLEKAEEPIDRFGRALTIERRAAAGEHVGAAERTWLFGYQTTGEYRGLRRMHEDFGDTMFLK